MLLDGFKMVKYGILKKKQVSNSILSLYSGLPYTRSHITRTRLYRIIAYFEGHLPHQKSLH